MQVPINVTHLSGALVSSLIMVAPAIVVIGRHQGCDVRLESDDISRRHARLLLGAATFIVEDLSSNGTGLEPGDVVQRSAREVFYGKSLRIGPYVIEVGNVEAPQPQPQPQARHDSGARRPVTRTTAHLGAGTSHRGHCSSRNMTTLARADGRPLAAAAAATRALTKAPARGPTPVVLTAVPSAPPLAPALAAVRVATPAGAARDRGLDAVALRRRIHQELLKNVDLTKMDATRSNDGALRPRVITALKRIVQELAVLIPPHVVHDQLIGELVEEALGLGPLEPLLADPTVTEIMVVDPRTIYVERSGRLELTSAIFTDDERVRAVIERIVTPLGRRIDESQPLVDARLPDGSRVNAIIRPLALRGTCITIRKFPKFRLGVDELIALGSLSIPMARFLARCVLVKKNILISGGTGSGKTTLLNVLSGTIPSDERIVTIEDAAELQLHQPHVVTLETKAPNMEGKGAFTIRDLVRNSLRMRPDRIIVGECRGGEALDMLQAMNTGHDGSLTTIHANSPTEALARLETLALMAGLDLPARAIREQIGRSIHVIVQQARMSDGSRRVTHISEIDELDDSGRFEVRNIFEFDQTGVGGKGEVQGDFQATGYLPSFLDEFFVRGVLGPGEPCL